MGNFYVYILASDTGTLYIGITRDLIRRVGAHKEGCGSLFTRKYHVNKLVYYEEFEDPLTAIEREKYLKTFRRSRKIQLIHSLNPGWRVLALEE